MSMIGRSYVVRFFPIRAREMDHHSSHLTSRSAEEHDGPATELAGQLFEAPWSRAHVGDFDYLVAVISVVHDCLDRPWKVCRSDASFVTSPGILHVSRTLQSRSL